jgi:hypothetical protein
LEVVDKKDKEITSALKTAPRSPAFTDILPYYNANSLGRIGGLIYSLATNAMIQSIGLGWAFRVLAILSCAVNVICTITVRDRNRAVGSVLKSFDIKLLKRMEYLLLVRFNSPKLLFIRGAACGFFFLAALETSLRILPPKLFY